MYWSPVALVRSLESISRPLLWGFLFSILQVADAGLYSCQAVNPGGDLELHIKFSVHGETIYKYHLYGSFLFQKQSVFINPQRH